MKKGVDLLIKAYTTILKNSLLPLPRLVIAGPGLETAYGKEMQTIASVANEQETHIFFTGMLSGEAKWGAIYGCEAFLLPSHQENFGIAVAEALACSKPVLISNQVNIWREIDEAGAGIVSEDTLEGTSELLNRWVELSIDQKKNMGMKAADCFKNSFTIAPAARKFFYAVSQNI